MDATEERLIGAKAQPNSDPASSEVTSAEALEIRRIVARSLSTARETTEREGGAPTPTGFTTRAETPSVGTKSNLADALIAVGFIALTVLQLVVYSVAWAYDKLTDYLADLLRPAVFVIKAIYAFYKKHPEESKEMVRSAWNIAYLSYRTGVWNFTDAFKYLWEHTGGRMVQSARQTLEAARTRDARTARAKTPASTTTSHSNIRTAHAASVTKSSRG